MGLRLNQTGYALSCAGMAVRPRSALYPQSRKRFSLMLASNGGVGASSLARPPQRFQIGVLFRPEMSVDVTVNNTARLKQA